MDQSKKPQDQNTFRTKRHQGSRRHSADLFLPGAGLSDSCASCHGRPCGSVGSGGDMNTRPDSRDFPHLFGLGLKEMLADEITTDLRSTRDLAVTLAQQTKRPVTLKLVSKGVKYGSVTANRTVQLTLRICMARTPTFAVTPGMTQNSKRPFWKVCKIDQSRPEKTI